jgi:hypothetical protein
MSQPARFLSEKNNKLPLDQTASQDINDCKQFNYKKSIVEINNSSTPDSMYDSNNIPNMIINSSLNLNVTDININSSKEHLKSFSKSNISNEKDIESNQVFIMNFLNACSYYEILLVNIIRN